MREFLGLGLVCCQVFLYLWPAAVGQESSDTRNLRRSSHAHKSATVSASYYELLLLLIRFLWTLEIYTINVPDLVTLGGVDDGRGVSSERIAIEKNILKLLCRISLFIDFK